MAKLCAILSIAVLASLSGCSKEEDAEVKDMKASISKTTTSLRAEEEKLRDQKRGIEARLDTIDLRIRQMEALSSAMDQQAMPVATAAASKKEEERASAELKELREKMRQLDQIEQKRKDADAKAELERKKVEGKPIPVEPKK